MLSILIIDNHDSYTYNLVELLRQTQLCQVKVVLLDNVIENFTVQEIDGIILSPGPGLPDEKAGLFDFIGKIAGKIPLLGVCLGHQALAQFFGADLYQLKRIIHGEASEIKSVFEDALFNDIKFPIEIGRYHSWAVKNQSLPVDLQITSETSDGILMSFVHKKQNIRGVQFHPESILTPSGFKILKNWLTFCVKK